MNDLTLRSLYIGRQPMTSHHLAKLVGSLFLLQLVGGIFLNFFFLQQLTTELAQFDVTSTSLVIGVATILALALSAINLTVSAVSYHLLFKQYPIHNLILLGFSMIALGLTAIEYAKMGELMSLLAYFKSKGIDTLSESMLLTKHVVAMGRNEIHYLTIVISSISVLLFYALLFRATQIPKWLTGFALIACLLQLIAVSSTLFQSSVINIIQLPLVITQLVLPIYFIIYGFQITSRSKEKVTKTRAN